MRHHSKKTLTGAEMFRFPERNNMLLNFAILSAALLFFGLSPAETSPNVTFKVDMTGVDSKDGTFITGSFTGPEGQWYLVPMIDEGNGIFSYAANLNPGEEGAFYFLRGNDWDLRERVPSYCAEMWNVDRKYSVTESDITYSFKYGSCEEIDSK